MKKLKTIILFIILLLILNIKAYAINYGVGKIENNERPNLNIKEIIDNGGYTLGKDDNRIYLTFDCGYENGYTEAILDTLSENNVKAAFFITGHYLTSNTSIVKRMIDEGHLVCNHTNKHKSFSTSSVEEVVNDVKELEEMYNKEFNLEMVRYVRPPKGEYSVEALAKLNSLGYKSIFWSLAYVDWYKDKYNSNHYSYNEVKKRIHNGAIILMHTVSKDNMVDLKDIIIYLKQDYIFSSIEEL